MLRPIQPFFYSPPPTPCTKSLFERPTRSKIEIIDPNRGAVIEDLNDCFHVKKFDRDRLSCCDLIVFKPLLRMITPHLYNNVICNEEFLLSLSPDELGKLQQIVDFVLYRGNSTDLNCSISEGLSYLFLLNHMDGDLDKLKSNMIKMVTRKLAAMNTNQPTTKKNNDCDETGVPVEKMTKQEFNMKIDSLLERCESKYVTSTCLLAQLKPYCTIIFSGNIGVPFNFQSVQSPSLISYPLKKLYNDATTSDVKVVLPRSGKVVHCHKTILSSKSEFFEHLFEGNNTWSDYNSETSEFRDVDDSDDVEFILEYCYEIANFNNVKRERIYPLMKKAHEHSIKAIIVNLTKQLKTSREGIEECLEELALFLDDPLFESVLQFINQH